MLRALAEFDVEGVPTIVPFHRLVVTDERFRAGEHTTDYLDDRLDRGSVERAVEEWGSDPPTGEGGGSGTAEEGTTERAFTVEVNDQRFEVELEVSDRQPEAGGTDRPPAAEPARPERPPTDADEPTTGSDGKSVDAGDLLVVLE